MDKNLGKQGRHLILGFVSLMWLSMLPISALGGYDPYFSEPRLRIETGSHTDTIYRMSIDAKGQLLATVSQDKTARIWDLQSHKLQRILRPPIGEGLSGVLYAVAVTPDGNTVAVGGTNRAVLLFDPNTGQMTRRLDELPHTILDLAYSPDGQWLVIAYAGKSGVQLYNARTLNLVTQDTNYEGSCNAIDFDRTGRLITVADDHSLRLYDIGTEGEGLEHPYVREKIGWRFGLPRGVNFSPNGENIAISYFGITKIEIFSGKDLQPQSEMPVLDIAPNEDQFLTTVAWSPEGKYVYAAGSYHIKGQVMIRKWELASSTDVQDFPVSQNGIEYLLPLPTGEIVFGTHDPLLGILPLGNSDPIILGARSGDFRGLYAEGGWFDRHEDYFLISKDGRTVQFPPYLNDQLVSFSTTDRRLIWGRDQKTEFFSARREVSGTCLFICEQLLTDWKNSFSPKIDGHPLPLLPEEKSYSVAFTPDDSHFVLGTSSHLRFFTDKGKELWDVQLPGHAYAVNLSADGELIVAALSDGTIRWYRVDDGSLLLSFFLHVTSKEWVLWTPQGYYTSSSIDSEDYLGWHLNQGPNQEAKWYPVSQFRELRNVELVNAVMQSKRSDFEVLKQTASTMLQERLHQMATKPLVRILSPNAQATIGPTTEAPVIEVIIEAEDRGEGVKEILLQHNGGLVGFLPRAKDLALRPHVRTGQTHVKRFQVRLVDGVNEFAATAVSRKGTESDPTRLALVCDCPALNHEPTLPTLHVMTVGITNYAKISSLSFPQKDAEALAAVFQGTAPSTLFSRTIIYPLFNQQATKTNLIAHFQSIKEIHPQDVLVLFFAGHGTASQDEWYFAPYDFDPTLPLADAGLAGAEIKKLVASKMAQGVRNILLLIDSCHSGQLTKAFPLGLSADLRRPAPEEFDFQAWNQFKKVTGIHVIAASTSEQKAFEVEGLGHGVYARALLNGLEGDADIARDGEISVLELLNYVTFAVPQLMSGIQQSIAEKIQPTDRSSTLTGSPTVSLPLLSQEEQELLEQLNLGQTPVASIQGKNFSLVLANQK